MVFVWQPMFAVREFKLGDHRDLLISSLWGTVARLFSRGQYLWAIPLLLCSGVWPYVRLLLMTLTASPKAVLLVPVQRRRRLAILRDLGLMSALGPCMLLIWITLFRLDLPGAPSSAALEIALSSGFAASRPLVLLPLACASSQCLASKRVTVDSLSWAVH